MVLRRSALSAWLAASICGAIGCAPDLRLGSSEGTGGTVGGAGGTTSTGGGGSTGGNDTSGQIAWATSVTGDGDEVPRAVGRTEAGELILAVEITGTLDIDSVASAGATDVAVVTFSETGKAVSAVRLGGLNPQSVTGIAVDHAGSTILTGDFSGSIASGAKQANSAGGRDCYVAKLDSTGGATWIRDIGGEGHDGCVGVAIDSKNNILVAGTFTGDLGNLTSQGGEDAFVMKLSPSGSTTWTYPLGDAHAQRARAIAVGPEDSVVALAEIEGTLSIGDGEVASAGGTDILLLTLDKDGSVKRTQAIGTTGDDIASRLAVDGATGQVVISGAAASDLDLGGGAISGKAFIASYDGDGKHLLSRGFSSKDSLSVDDIALGAGGAVLVAGTFSGGLTVGGELLTSVGGQDVFVSKLDAAGGVIWARSFGGADTERATRVLAGKSGEALVAGTLFGSAVFGADTLGPTQGDDLVFFRLTP